MRIRIIGVGTSFGDDAAGPRVVQHLASGRPLPRGVEAVLCGRPLDLVELLDGADGAVLVDATSSGRAPGTVHEPATDDLCEARPVSSHGLGVREALAMAEALGRAPQRIAIIGIEAASTTGEELSRPVHAALAEAATRARQRCAEWLAGGEASHRA
ncbi:MAG: hydrogenase maturation protease [Myxococcota bacterium]